MAGFSSMDDIVSKISASGQSYRSDWNKLFLPTSPAVANDWHCLFRGAGNPGADAIANTTTNLTWQQLKDTTANATGIRHGGDVSPYYKYVMNGSIYTSAATTSPAMFMLVDMLGFYRVTTTTTTTAQSTINTLVAFSEFTVVAATDVITHTNINLLNYSTVQVSTTTTLPAGLSAATDYYWIKVSDLTGKLASSYANAVAGTPIDITDTGTGTHTINTLLPRYTNGAGVQAFAWANNATPLGAGTPDLSLVYTNAVAAGSKATPAVLPIGKTACPNGQILYSGTGTGKYGPFYPQATLDTGVRSIESIRHAATYTSGEYSVALCHPVCQIPIMGLGVVTERDFLNQLPSLPRVYDGACLVWLVYSGVATPTNSGFYGHFDFAWG